MSKSRQICYQCHDRFVEPDDMSGLCEDCIKNPRSPSSPRSPFEPRESETGAFLSMTDPPIEGGFESLSPPESPTARRKRSARIQRQTFAEIRAQNDENAAGPSRSTYHRKVTEDDRFKTPPPSRSGLKSEPALSELTGSGRNNTLTPKQRAKFEADLAIVDAKIAEQEKAAASEYRLWLHTYMSSGYTREEARQRILDERKGNEEIERIAQMEAEEYERLTPRSPRSPKDKRKGSGAGGAGAGAHAFFRQDLRDGRKMSPPSEYE